MCSCTGWVVDWDAVAAIGTLLAVVVALGTTGYLEYKAHRRRMIEVRSMASALHWEFEANRRSLVDDLARFRAAPKTAVTAETPRIPGTNGQYNRLPALAFSEGLKRCRFSVLKSVAGRISLFDEVDAVALGRIVAASTAFQENQDLESESIFAMDDAHAQMYEAGMTTWASSLAELLGPAARRMGEMAGLKLNAPEAA